MFKKTAVSNFNAIDSNKSLTYDIKTMSKVFKDFFSNLVESFLAKLPDPSNKYNLESVFLYYSNFAIPELFHIFPNDCIVAKLKLIFKKGKKIDTSN